jgi:hypothetical protein
MPEYQLHVRIRELTGATKHGENLDAIGALRLIDDAISTVNHFPNPRLSQFGHYATRFWEIAQAFDSGDQARGEELERNAGRFER